MERTGPPTWSKRNSHVIVRETFFFRRRAGCLRLRRITIRPSLFFSSQQLNTCVYLHHNNHVSDSTGGGYHEFVQKDFPTWTEDATGRCVETQNTKRTKRVWLSESLP
ncbi:hypothetical protein PAMP_022132 [Pampus punctatissimus]